MADRTLIVLGPRASGVAEAARDLAALGFEPVAADAQDELDDAVLALLESPDPQPLDVAPGWEHQPGLEPLRERARALLDGRAVLSGTRLSRTLPFWRALLPGESHFVICLCAPTDVAAAGMATVGAHPGVGPWNWGESWLDVTARAIDEARGAPRVTLLADEPELRAERLAAFVGAPAGSPAPTVVGGGVADPPVADWRLPAEAHAAHLLLRAAEDARRRPGALSPPDDLERAAIALWRAQRAAASTRAHRDDVRGHLDWTREELERTRQAFAQTEAVLEQATDVMEAAGAEQERLHAALEAAHAEIARLRGA